MANYSRFNGLVGDLARGVHNLASGSCALTVALTAAANAPSATMATALSSITQVSYTNLSSRALTVGSLSGSPSGATEKLVLSDLTLTASGTVATWRYIVIYNDTPTNDNMIAYYDHGGDVAMENGDTHLIDFDATNGFLAITVS